MKRIWTRATVLAWLENYSKATSEFDRMEKDEKLEILAIIRSNYPEGHGQLAAIDAQIERIRKQ